MARSFDQNRFRKTYSVFRTRPRIITFDSGGSVTTETSSATPNTLFLRDENASGAVNALTASTIVKTSGDLRLEANENIKFVVNNGQGIQFICDGLQLLDLNLDTTPIFRGTELSFTIDSLGISAGTLQLASSSSNGVLIGGTSANDRLKVVGNSSNVELSVTSDHTLDFYSTTTRLFEVGQSSPSFTITSDADGASNMVLGAGGTFTISQSNSTSGAGRTLTVQAQKGASGFVGADVILAAGDGGTAGTNSAGNVRVKLGTPVSNQTGQFYLEREDGTKILTAYEIANGTCGIYGGSLGGGSLHLQGQRVTLQSSANTLRFRHPASSGIEIQEGTTTVAQLVCDADGATLGTTRLKLNAATANVSPQFIVASDTIDLLTVRQSAANTTEITAGAQGTTTTGAICKGNYWNFEPSLQVSLSCPNIYNIATGGSGKINNRIGNGTGEQILADTTSLAFERRKVGSVETADDSEVSVVSIVTASGFVYRARAIIVAGNKDDDELAYSGELHATFANIAGTLTQVGTTVPVGVEKGPNSSACTAEFIVHDAEVAVAVYGHETSRCQWQVILEVYPAQQE